MGCVDVTIARICSVAEVGQLWVCVSTAWADRVDRGPGHGGSGSIEPGLDRCGTRRRRQKLESVEAFDHEHGLRAERALDLSRGYTAPFALRENAAILLDQDEAMTTLVEESSSSGRVSVSRLD